MNGYVKYDSNNSGGSWWLDDDDWKALEKAGWVVGWCRLTTLYDKDGVVRAANGVPKLIPVEDAPKRPWFVEKNANGEYRFLGALADVAYKPNCTDIRAAAKEWEQITGKCATDAGCPCCGQPHTFAAYGPDGKYLESGP